MITTRVKRGAALLTCVLLSLGGILTLGASPAGAGATSGVLLTPVPAFDDEGRRQTTFRLTLAPQGEARAKFTVTNLTAGVQRARVYVASAQQGRGGEYDVGGPASARHLQMPTEELTLAPRETRSVEFRAQAGSLKAGAATTDAVVLEQESGAVVERAASLVYLRVERGVPVVPLALTLFAATCILGVSAGLWKARRRRPATGAAG